MTLQLTVITSLKEHTRLKVIAAIGYKPIRVMFYYPNRDQAIRIQKTLETLYKGVNGEYYFGDTAWDFINTYTGVHLKRNPYSHSSGEDSQWFSVRLNTAIVSKS